MTASNSLCSSKSLRQSVNRRADGNFSAARPRCGSVSSISHSATTSTWGLAAVAVRSDQPLPPVPTDATRNRLLAPKTRDQLAAGIDSEAPARATCFKNRRRDVRSGMAGAPGGVDETYDDAWQTV